MLLIALLIVVPLVEITVIVQVAALIGGWEAIGLLLVVSVVGAWIVKHEGFVVLGRIRAELDQGRLPAGALVEGGLILVGGLLLLVPGFVTDALGLLLVFPPTRALVRRVVQRRFRARVQVFGITPPGGRTRSTPRRPPGPGGGDDVIDV